jgi:hypothetical protein
MQSRHRVLGALHADASNVEQRNVGFVLKNVGASRKAARPIPLDSGVKASFREDASFSMNAVVSSLDAARGVGDIKMYIGRLIRLERL